MSWTGEYWGPDGAIATAEGIFAASAKTAHDHVRLASVYYSAATRALAECRRWRLWCLWYVFRCGHHALTLCDKVFFTAVGWSQAITLDDFDVILTIMQRFGNPFNQDQRRCQRSLLAIASGRLRNGELCKPHTQAFLWLHAMRLGGQSVTEELIFQLESLAAKTAAIGDFAQAARVNKQIAYLLPRRDQRRQRLLHEAMQLAARAGATDQIEKIKAGL